MGSDALRRSGVWRSARAALLAEVRARPDVASGVTADSRDGRVRTVEYRPGNGRRFSVVLTDLEGIGAAGRVAGSGKTLVWVREYGRGFTLGDGPVTSEGVQDGLRCSVTDAASLAELLGFLTGREAESAEEFARRASA